MRTKSVSRSTRGENSVKGRAYTKILTEAVVDHWTHKRWAAYVEIASEQWGRRRIDVFCINMRGETVGIEVKATKADLQGDNKWHHYLSVCNQFYFCVPTHLAELAIEKARENEVGVCVINEDTGYLKIIKSSPKFDTDEAVMRKMLLRLVWRSADFNRRNRKRRTRRWTS